MKTHIENLISGALAKVLADIDDIADIDTSKIDTSPGIENARDPKFGHFSSNIAMRLAKVLRQKPRDIAEKIQASLPNSEFVSEVSIAGPGFINFRLADSAFHAELKDILSKAEQYGQSNIGKNRKVILEYVSANPTGPLHVGHGRHAAYGACLANLYKATGHDVHQEYYVNDAGRQMDILALSVWLRWLEANNNELNFPSSAYRGDYVTTIAASCDSIDGLPTTMPAELFASLPEDADQQLDALIARCRDTLGEESFRAILQLALDGILGDIRDDLAEGFRLLPMSGFQNEA